MSVSQACLARRTAHGACKIETSLEMINTHVSGYRKVNPPSPRDTLAALAKQAFGTLATPYRVLSSALSELSVRAIAASCWLTWYSGSSVALLLKRTQRLNQ